MFILSSDISIMKLIFYSDQRIFCCSTDGKVQVDEEQRRHGRIGGGFKLSSDLIENNRLGKDITRSKH